MSSEVDEMLQQFKRNQEKLKGTREDDTEDHEQAKSSSDATTTSAKSTPEPTAKPLTDSKPIKPDRSSKDSSSTSSYTYTPVDIDRRLAKNYRPTDVPSWMYGRIRTRTYAAGHSQVFHADRNCWELNQSDSDRIKIYPLRFVVERDVNPSRPCDLCTMDMATTIRVAIEYDHVDPNDVADSYQEYVDEVTDRGSEGTPEVSEVMG